MLTVFSDTIDYISPIGTKRSPYASCWATIRPSGANVSTPSQYVYIIIFV